MIQLRATAALALAPALCAGCAGGSANRIPVQLISNSDIAVVRATARQKADGIIIGGDVRRPNGYAGVIPGHLRIIGRDNSGQIVATVDARWGEFMSRRFRRAYFKTLLPAPSPAAVTAISVEPVAK